MDSFSVLGASGNPCRAWLDGPTGLADVMEGYCPPHFADMRKAVERCASANSAQSLRRRTTSLRVFSHLPRERKNQLPL